MLLLDFSCMFVCTQIEIQLSSLHFSSCKYLSSCHNLPLLFFCFFFTIVSNCRGIVKFLFSSAFSLFHGNGLCWSSKRMWYTVISDLFVVWLLLVVVCFFLSGCLPGTQGLSLSWVKFCTCNMCSRAWLHIYVHLLCTCNMCSRAWLHIYVHLLCTCNMLSLIHIWRCRRLLRCRSRWSPYH